MNEQIIITKNDNGIELKVSYINSKNKPVDITENSVSIVFVSPSSRKIQKEAFNLDSTNGIVGVMLDQTLTSEEGLWKAYFSCYDKNGFVTAQETVNYYVLPMHGGE